jgi:hypothetical protein
MLTLVIRHNAIQTHSRQQAQHIKSYQDKGEGTRRSGGRCWVFGITAKHKQMEHLSCSPVTPLLQPRASPGPPPPPLSRTQAAHTAVLQHCQRNEERQDGMPACCAPSPFLSDNRRNRRKAAPHESSIVISLPLPPSLPPLLAPHHRPSHLQKHPFPDVTVRTPRVPTASKGPDTRH